MKVSRIIKFLTSSNLQVNLTSNVLQTVADIASSIPRSRISPLVTGLLFGLAFILKLFLLIIENCHPNLVQADANLDSASSGSPEEQVVSNMAKLM